jgi:hypothetical protein
MEQRPLRLGDLVDDYCPRERRLTNHAIVAIVGDEIRQTRCNTCEAEHVYKGGKVPVRKKKDATAVLYDQVLANVTGVSADAIPPPVVAVPVAAGTPVARVTPPAEAATPVPEPEPTPEPVIVVDETWTLHRTLIRASLPRNENHVPTPRPIPEFTMHQRNVRGSHMFRSGGGGGERQPGGFGMNGDGPPRNHFRGDSQPGEAGASNGPRPGGSGRRRRRSKKPRPTN